MEEMLKVSQILGNRTRQGGPVISSPPTWGHHAYMFIVHKGGGTECSSSSTLATTDMAGIARDNG